MQEGYPEWGCEKEREGGKVRTDKPRDSTPSSK